MDTAYIDLHGMRMFYRLFGDGPPLLLLHGGWLTGDLNWSACYPELARHFRVIVPDLRGHGRSDNPDGGFSSYRRFTWDMIEFLERLNLGERPRVMGHSSGAAIALHMSVVEPELIARQVLIGIHRDIGVSPSYRRGMERMFITPDHRRPPTKWRFVLRHPLYAAVLRREHRTTPWHRLLQQSWPLWLAPMDIDRDDYGKILSPTLIITGDEDEFGESDEFRAFKALIPGAHLETLSGEDHLSLVFEPERLLGVAIPFLRDSV